ncbi:MAG: cupredoxin domain-containing protein [Actinomycetota bacterium]
MRSLIRAGAALGAVALYALALGSPAATARAARETHTVEAQGTFPVFRYVPAEIEVAAGDKVVWVNTTDNEHHVTPYDGPWADRGHLHLAAGKKVSFRFKEPGSYRYYCDLPYHGQLIGPLCFGQCGSVVVE